VQRKRVLQGMARLMPEDAQAGGMRSTFDFAHPCTLDAAQPRMREIERDGDAWDAPWRKPFCRKPKVRPQLEPGSLELHGELTNGTRQPRAVDAEPQGAGEIAQAHRQEIVVRHAGDTWHQPHS
jgi:hypothetical protein